ncbi:MAG: phospholipid carrier-dependent glycosyltransferase, partial [Clostridia bacterium]|nr:phospholipid carrier-dependent glycosyltransferase [Clostridia bacterium]
MSIWKKRPSRSCVRNRFLANLHSRLVFGYLVLWTVLNGLTLTVFPAVHSDEAWLAGLAKAYLDQGSVMATEPFFDLFPRQPHAFKMLFHVLQAGLIWVLGFDVFAVRLLSLLAAVVTLILVYRGIARLTARRDLALGLTVALSLQPLFLTTAHLARQESLILAVLAAAFTAVPWIRLPRQGFCFGLLLGGAALIHPNALFPAAIAGLVLLWNTIYRRVSLKTLLFYGTGLAVAGSILVALSLGVSPGFLQNYAEFGANLAVDAAPNQRGANLMQFLRQLWRQDNGTYWLPDLRGLLVATPVLAVLGLAARVRAREEIVLLENGLQGLVGFVLALFVIGRFNPTSIVFVLVPLVWILGGILSTGWPKYSRKILLPRLGRLAPLLLAVGAILAGTVALPHNFGSFVSQRIGTGEDPYQEYSAEIQRHLPEHAIVLGNLSAGFVLQQTAESFYDLRNLTYVTNNIGPIEHRFQSENNDPDNTSNHAPTPSTSDAPAPSMSDAPTPSTSNAPAPSMSDAPLSRAADAAATSQSIEAAVAAYLTERGINAVIWYEEYDFILRNPDWWVLYEIRPG